MAGDAETLQPTEPVYHLSIHKPNNDYPAQRNRQIKVNHIPFQPFNTAIIFAL